MIIAIRAGHKRYSRTRGFQVDRIIPGLFWDHTACFFFFFLVFLLFFFLFLVFFLFIFLFFFLFIIFGCLSPRATRPFAPSQTRPFFYFVFLFFFFFFFCFFFSFVFFRPLPPLLPPNRGLSSSLLQCAKTSTSKTAARLAPAMKGNRKRTTGLDGRRSSIFEKNLYPYTTTQYQQKKTKPLTMVRAIPVIGKLPRGRGRRRLSVCRLSSFDGRAVLGVTNDPGFPIGFLPGSSTQWAEDIDKMSGVPVSLYRTDHRNSCFFIQNV